ncbi:MAG: hypothetical protein K6G22_01890 [Lachnospiraceae bacterium]|nr:hypothetical protein [Lachnospiraceae bacterium]
MLDHIETIFNDLEYMLRKLKKASYEANMKRFRGEQGHFINEMIGYVKDAEDPEAAVSEIGRTFADGVFGAFSNKGKINGRRQADLNFFMIYYVFPAILLTDEPCADSLCTGIKDAWNGTFKDTNISYTTYQKLYDSFRTKIFGIF